MVKLGCECSSFDCRLSVEVDTDEAYQILTLNAALIVDECRSSNYPANAVVKKGQGYKVYTVKDKAG